MDNETIALHELGIISERLKEITEEAEKRKGHIRPIIEEVSIELLKDHLDLVVKYSWA